MVFFITFLRALAAIIITNSHYVGVYPTDIIANGGLLGDVLFFAVSGYCLANIKLSFGKWYLKRFVRVYPPVIIITLIYLMMGQYYLTGVTDIFKMFVFPTQFHFVASIVLLYIPFYFVMKFEVLKKRIPLVILGTFLIQMIVYIFFYDKSVYHIDDVHNWMIRFLFFIAMLIGAYVKVNDSKYRNNSKVINIIMSVLLCGVYFASKMFFVKYSADAWICQFQIVNQVVLIALMYFLFITIAGFDSKLEKLPDLIKRFISSISAMTLEIYLVQYVLIKRMNIGVFPLNWLIITGSIVFMAIVLHVVSEKAIGKINNGIKHLENRKK